MLLIAEKPRWFLSNVTLANALSTCMWIFRKHSFVSVLWPPVPMQTKFYYIKRIWKAPSRVEVIKYFVLLVLVRTSEKQVFGNAEVITSTCAQQVEVANNVLTFYYTLFPPAGGNTIMNVFNCFSVVVGTEKYS